MSLSLIRIKWILRGVIDFPKVFSEPMYFREPKEVIAKNGILGSILISLKF